MRSASEARLDARRHQRRVQELESQCARRTAAPSGTPGGGEHGLEELWALLADARDEEVQAIRSARAREGEVNAFIQSLPISLHRTILRLKYLECMSWTRLQFALCDEGVYYSDRQLRRIHGAALESARLIWKTRQEDDEHGEPRERQIVDVLSDAQAGRDDADRHHP